MRFLFVLLFVHTIAFAQSLPKGFAENERKSGFLPSIGIFDNPYQQRSTQNNVFTTPPSEQVRTMAEWEEIQALTITWSTGYSIEEEAILSQIVANAVQQAQVIIICENESEVLNYLQSENIPTDNVSCIESMFNNIWIRDYGQNSVYKNDVDELILVDWIYNRNRPFDDLVPDQIANFLNIDLYATSESPWDLMSTGGNFMSDGMGLGFSSELIIDENSGGYAWEGLEGNVFFPNHSEEEINTILNEFMGIEEYILMETLPYDGIHHIDMHMKLIDEETLLVAEYPEGVADGPQIEANLQYVLENYTSSFGTPFKVIRIPSPPSTSGNYPDDNGYYRTYTNSVFVNNTVLVPFYRTEYDTIAQRIYEEALPGYNIVGIDVDNQGQNLISYSGAIHCITHSVGVDQPLLIQHQSLLNTYPLDEYIFNANIQHKTGIETATLFWTDDLANGYQAIDMSNNEGNNWQGILNESIELPATIYYYIQATAFSGKTQVRPLPAPEGYFDFNIFEDTISEPVDTITEPIDTTSYAYDLTPFDIDLGVYPNPASALTCIPIESTKAFNAKLYLTDILGKEVAQIHQGQVKAPKTNFFIRANEFTPGVYFITLELNAKVLRKKLIIK
ncbi:MAG: agmatine deiminase family protein [Bacteroidota bacterium]|nr:agmatine deiminase family protein [Bacteroidota bacterium]